MARQATKKTTRKPAKKRETKATQNAKKQMWAVVLFAVGVLMAALTFIKGDKLWQSAHEVLFGLLGWSAYFISPLIIYIAVIAALDKPLSSIKAKIWQVLVLIIMISGAIQIFSGMPDSTGVADTARILFYEAVNLRGGGVLSALFAVPLLAATGDTGARIIIILAMFVFLMLITGSTLISLYKWVTRPVKDLGDVYTEYVEERAKRPVKELKPEKPKLIKKTTKAPFNIDVSIEDDSEYVEWEETEASKPEAREEEKNSPDTAEEDTAPPELYDDNFNTFAEDLPVEYIDLQPTANGKGNHPLKDEISAMVTPQNVVQISDKFTYGVQGASPQLSDSFIPDNVVNFPGTEIKTPAEIKPQTTQPAAQAPNNPPNRARAYTLPSIDLLVKNVSSFNESQINDEMHYNSQVLENTLKSFGVQIRVVDICRGPAVTRYEIQPSAGVKISRITSLSDDIALALAAAGIRIEAPIPNKSAVGIEIPNKNVSIVGIREIIDSRQFANSKSSITVSLGKDITGNIITADIGKMPHMLVAGSTGSGKSVCINSLIISILYKSSPDDVKFVMIDPKMVELGIYNGIPHLLIPVVTDPKKAAGALNWAVVEMLKRYEAFKENQVRDIESYNKLAKARDDLEYMPKIVIIIDELADLMMTAPKDVEEAITRLAQMARAAGMHLIIATQRPSVSVITGDIKANIPSRVAFAVSSQFDSRTILDMGGAEKLLGRGDMLFYPVGAAKPVRVQGCFVTDTEVEKVVEHVKSFADVSYDESVIEMIDSHVIAEKGSKKSDSDDGGGFDDNDEMLPAAMECVVEAGTASTSLLQRRLKLGYARAARIMDQLQEKGVVGPSEGAKPRQVLISRDMWIEMKLTNNENSARENVEV